MEEKNEAKKDILKFINQGLLSYENIVQKQNNIFKVNAK